MTPYPSKIKERGAVLLTTMLLMTVMAAITVAIMDDIRLSIKRTMSIQAAEQLDWYMRGGEDFAGTWLQTNLTGERQAVLATYINAKQEITLPLDEGVLTAQLGDARNCYNLNQLAAPKTAGPERERFTRLLRFLEFDNIQAEIIAGSVQDWVDSNTAPTQGGAEDLYYTNLVPPYHPANTMMVDVSELRAVQGVDEEAYQRLLPFVCAGQDDKAGKINLNTLSDQQAPLLALIFGSDEGLRAAQAVIAQRPELGYEDIETVWAIEAVEDLELKGVGKDMVSLITDQIYVDIRVTSGGQTRTQRVLFATGGGAGAELISRRPIP